MTWGESRARIQSVSLEVARWAITRMAAEIRASGAVPALLALSPADPLPKDPTALLRLGRDVGLVSFDLLHLYDGQDLAAIRVAPWDNHANALGQRMIADELYNQLREQAGALHFGSPIAPPL